MFGLLNFKKRMSMPVDEKASVLDASYVVIDTELTGLDERKDSIVSLGALKMTGGRIELGESFYRLANPETALTSESVVIHGITPSDVVEKPSIDTVLAEFLQFCNDAIIVGHYISIDMCFINREMKRLFGRVLKNPVLDTLLLYDFVRSAVPSHSSFTSPPRDYKQLYDIARNLGIPVSGAHNAMMDAFITAQVFQRLIPMLAGIGITSVGDLLKLRLKGGDRFRVSCELSNL